MTNRRVSSRSRSLSRPSARHATRGTASSSSWQGGAPVGKARLQLAIARARERSRSPIKGTGSLANALASQRMERGDNRIPDTLLHGTYVKHLENIWRYGLVAGGVSGGRHDVHTVRHTNGMKDRSGVRHGSDAIIFIDGAALRNDQDAKIRLSLNDVFLVEREIPKEYLICAVHRATGKILPMPRIREGRVISTDEIKRLMGGVSALSTADLKIKIALLEDKLKQTRADLAMLNYM